ncbi:MAG: hypothetical protein IJZ62_04795 [Clostridia bacterium]|nr:hypothetical protein [Clostridia bacterium]
MKLSFTRDQFLRLLEQFQSAIDSGEYTEKIPYDTWRKLKKLNDPKIEFTSPFVRVYDTCLNMCGCVKDYLVFSAKVYDWGFGRFFYDTVVKEREKMTNMGGIGSHTVAASACNTATKASAVEGKIASCESITYAGDPWENYGTADAAKLADAYYGTTTTDHTVAIAGEPLSSNTIELNIPSLDHLGRWDNGCWDAVASKSDMEDRFNKLEAELQKKVDKSEMKKENDTMMKGINFDFGPCGNTVRLSMYGMAIQNVNGEWVSYNPESREIINVDVFNMADGGKYMYKMPVAISDVAVGDIVIHNRVPMFVTAINENGTFEVTDVRAGEAKTVIPTRNMFGFNFMTKVVSLFGAFSNAPTADQPFGNMLPFLMLNGDNKDIDPMMFMFMMNQGNMNFNSNPMMWYFLVKDNKEIDPLLLMAMTGSFNLGQAHTCNCNKTAEAPATQN